MIEKIKETDINAKKMASVATRPNSTGLYGTKALTANELKERMDALPMLAIEKVNELIDVFGETKVLDILDDIAISLGANREGGYNSVIFNDLNNIIAYGDYSIAHGKSTSNFKEIDTTQEIYYKPLPNAIEKNGKYDFESLQFSTDNTDSVGTVDKVYSYKDQWKNTCYTLWADHHPNIGEDEAVTEVTQSAPIYKTILFEALVNGGESFSVTYGEASVVFGVDSIANGQGAFAAGINAISAANYSVAMGRDTEARAPGAFVAGLGGKATGMYSFAVNEKGVASGYASAVFGDHCESTNFYAISGGYLSRANGKRSFAMGFGCKADGDNSTAIGDHCEAKARNTVAIGRESKAIANHSISLGNECVAHGLNGVAIGYDCGATGESSMAMVCQSKANGGASFAAGFNAETEGRHSVAIGKYVIAKADNQTALGKANAPITNGDDPSKNAVLIVGNGLSDTKRSNAMVVYEDGNVSIGASTPTSQSHVTPKGYVDKAIAECKSYTSSQLFYYKSMTGGSSLPNSVTGTDGSIAIGRNNTVKGNNASVAIGNANTVEADNAYAMGVECKSLGSGAVAMGRFSESNGQASFAVGHKAIANGKFSTAIGRMVESSDYQTVVGRGNALITSYGSKNDAVFIVGVGMQDDARANGLIVYGNGRVELGANPSKAMDAATKQYVDAEIEKLRKELTK